MREGSTALWKVEPSHFVLVDGEQVPFVAALSLAQRDGGGKGKEPKSDETTRFMGKSSINAIRDPTVPAAIRKASIAACTFFRLLLGTLLLE